MQRQSLGGLWPVSTLTISAAGLASIWGKTPEDEGIAALFAALDAGINHVDVAPSYGRGRAEQLLGKAMASGWPQDVRLTTKTHVGTLPPEEVLPKMRTSLQRSLRTMNREQVDLFVLHSQLIADGWQCARNAEVQHRVTTPLSLYRDAVIPAMRALVAEGLCAAWGITGIGPCEPVRVATEDCTAEDRPAAVQCIVNMLESPGALDFADPQQWPPKTRQVVSDAGIGVLGIRLVQAGALTDAMDRAPRETDGRDFEDYERAAGLRELAAEAGMPMAVMAYRYGLGDKRVDSHILGVKNRDELADCLRAVEAGPLPDELMARIAECRRAVGGPTQEEA